MKFGRCAGIGYMILLHFILRVYSLGIILNFHAIPRVNVDAAGKSYLLTKYSGNRQSAVGFTQGPLIGPVCGCLSAYVQSILIRLIPYG